VDESIGCNAVTALRIRWISVIQMLKRLRLLVGIATMVILVDQLTKFIVRSRMALGETWMPLEWLAPMFTIIHWENDSAAFGLYLGNRTVFITLSLAALLAILLYYLRLLESDWSMRLCLSFLTGGIAGNMIDRLHQGTVTDFLGVAGLYVLNLADVSNLAAVIILLVGVIREERAKSALKAPPSLE